MAGLHAGPALRVHDGAKADLVVEGQDPKPLGKGEDGLEKLGLAGEDYPTHEIFPRPLRKEGFGAQILKGTPLGHAAELSHPTEACQTQKILPFPPCPSPLEGEGNRMESGNAANNEAWRESARRATWKTPK